MRRRQRGFTLIELLLVVALIGIIGSIVVPSFLSILREASIKRVISDLEAIGFEIETFEVRKAFHVNHASISYVCLA